MQFIGGRNGLSNPIPRGGNMRGDARAQERGDIRGGHTLVKRGGMESQGHHGNQQMHPSRGDHQNAGQPRRRGRGRGGRGGAKPGEGQQHGNKGSSFNPVRYND